MKLLSFTHRGRKSFGALTGESIVDLGSFSNYSTMLQAIEAGAVYELIKIAKNTAPDIRLVDVELDVPLPDARNYICVGRNYKGHVAEAHAALPEYPSIFVRLGNSFVPSGQSIQRPKVSGDFDYEGELAVVIGKGGRHILREHAISHIMGYTMLMDGSIRDYQFKHCLVVGKNFFASGSVGPWIVTADEIDDPSRLELRTRLNGIEVQHTMTDDFIFDIPYIINYISTFTELQPGDIIATGTPEGVGFARKPPLWLKAGDHLEVEISKIGILSNTVIDE